MKNTTENENDIHSRRLEPSRREVLKGIGAGITLLPFAGLAGCAGEEPEPPAPPAPPSSPSAGGGSEAAPAPAPAPEATVAAGESAPAPQPQPAPAAGGADAPRLSEDDPTAAALGYRHDASEVDTEKWTKRAGPDGQNQFCRNCALYTGGDQAWGPCGIFPGKVVNANGWCNSWAPKT